MSDNPESFKRVDVDGLVVKIAKKAKAKPDDKDGWIIDVTVADKPEIKDKDNDNNNNNNNNKKKAVPKKETEKSPPHGFLVYATKDNYSKLHVFDVMNNNHTDELQLARPLSCLVKLKTSGYFCGFTGDADDNYGRPLCMMFKLTGDGKIAQIVTVLCNSLSAGTYIKSAVCDDDHNVFICTSRGEVYMLFVNDKMPENKLKLLFHSDIIASSVTCIAKNYHEEVLMCGTNDGVSLIDMGELEEISKYPLKHQKPIDSIVVLNKTNTRMMCNHHGSIAVVDCTQEGAVTISQNIGTAGELITTSPCRIGHRNDFVVGTDKGSIKKLTMDKNYHFETTVTAGLVDRPIDRLCVSKDGEVLFISTTEGRIIKVWDIVVDGKVAEKNAQRLIRVPHKDISNAEIADMILFNM
jgi:hypothetical protein